MIDKIYKLLFLKLFIFILFTGSTVTVAKQSKDERIITSFINGVAETIYLAAWPTAQYKSFRLKDYRTAASGYDVLVRFNGISAFDDSSLWLELLIEIRNGQLHDVKTHNHNAILSPPFSTIEDFGNLMAELAKPNTNQTRAKPESQLADAGGVCLRNTTTMPIKYYYRWGESESEWVSDTIEVGHDRWHWWPYQDKSKRQSPKFYIKYDDSLDTGYTEQSYWLERYAVALPMQCDDGKVYQFSLLGRKLDLKGI